MTAGPREEGDETSLASSVESLRRKSFADCTEAELALLARLMARLRLRAPERRTRRRRPPARASPDLRRTLRRAMRTGGEPIERAWRRRRVQRRRLLLVLDVSGSMSAYSRALAMFAHAALRTGPDWEAFAFSTRLTRMTRALSGSDPDAAFRAASAEVTDWDGGTRIGASLKRLMDEHGRTRAVRGAVCVILSDGLDVGDPAAAGRADGAPGAPGPPRGVAQPAEEQRPPTSRSRGAWRRRSPTSTSSAPATTSRAWRRWPT